jgi:hypothetical protein
MPDFAANMVFSVVFLLPQYESSLTDCRDITEGMARDAVQPLVTLVLIKVLYTRRPEDMVTSKQEALACDIRLPWLKFVYRKVCAIGTAGKIL